MSRIRTMSRTSVTLLGFAILSAVLCALVVGTAVAGTSAPINMNGGNAISNAPTMPLGQFVASDGSHAGTADRSYNNPGEFWRVQLGAGERLVLDWHRTQDCAVGGSWIYIYSPSATDGSLGVDDPFANMDANTWTAPTAGNWTVVFAGNGYGNRTNVCPYAFKATVQQATQAPVRTSAQVSAPKVVKHARLFTVTGGVSAAAGAPLTSKVTLTVTGPGLSKPLSQVLPLAGSGRFATHLRLSRAGVYMLKVVYVGDASHQASSASARIRVG